ncbi:hypothetical protein IJ182_00265 [bacterium]|nr:hypothetical protein [bacterium]
MQVSKVNTTVPNKINKINKSENINNKQNTSFKGLGVIDTVSLGVANAIENGGLAVSFTLQDMLGTNLPRPIMGLRRNKKENNGEKNFSFAAKEMVREFLTGPSMFIIPMTMLAIGKRAFGEAINVPMKFIKSFGDIHAKQPLNEAGKAITQEEFYQNAFSEMIKNAKNETEPSADTVSKAKDFAQRLVSNIGGSKKEAKETLTSLTDDFVEISKSHAQDVVHTDFTKAAVSANTAAPFKETVSHMMAYANDVVKKAAKQDTSKLTDFVKNTANKKVIGRNVMNVAMYASVLTFLQIIPKLYNKAEGKDNAGLKGLMKEETFNVDANNNKTDKSKPSFGSAEKVVQTLTSDKGFGKIANAFEFSGPNVSFPLLLGIMGGGILIPRTLRAKDKYDREEILRRDLVTCAVMCFAEKELRKGFSKLNETKSGLVLASKDKGFQDKSLPKKIFEYLRPINGVKVMTTDQIISRYTNIGDYNGGIKGFCDFVSGQGGHLGKVMSLTEESQNIVGGLLQAKGITDITKADNNIITTALDEAKDTEAVQRLISLFKDKNNPWVQKAKTLNARFTALSVLVLVPVFLGFLLPAINERATKKRINKEKELKAANNQNSNSTILNSEYLKKHYKENAIFSDMNQFIK